MRLIEVKDEILFAYKNGYVICHFASLDCSMKNTLSYKLKKEFSKWGIDYWCRRNVARKNDIMLGAALQHHNTLGNPPIYSLFIKRRHYNKYSYTHLQHALHDLKVKMLSNGEGNLAILKSSCVKGKDSEDWLEVIRIIENIFEDTNIDIWIYD